MSFIIKNKRSERFFDDELFHKNLELSHKQMDELQEVEGDLLSWQDNFSELSSVSIDEFNPTLHNYDSEEYFNNITSARIVLEKEDKHGIILGFIIYFYIDIYNTRQSKMYIQNIVFNKYDNNVVFVE